MLNPNMNSGWAPKITESPWNSVHRTETELWIRPGATLTTRQKILRFLRDSSAWVLRELITVSLTKRECSETAGMTASTRKFIRWERI